MRVKVEPYVVEAESTKDAAADPESGQEKKDGAA
jgi:hypothetical protein